MLDRRGFIGGLLTTPAIVRSGSLMRLALPRWYGMARFTDEGEIGWVRVSEVIADIFASTDFPSLAYRLPRWEACLRSGMLILPNVIP